MRFFHLYRDERKVVNEHRRNIQRPHQLGARFELEDVCGRGERAFAGDGLRVDQRIPIEGRRDIGGPILARGRIEHAAKRGPNCGGAVVTGAGRGGLLKRGRLASDRAREVESIARHRKPNLWLYTRALVQIKPHEIGRVTTASNACAHEDCGAPIGIHAK